MFKEFEYDSEFYVPEEHIFKNGGDCLDKFPDAGPACGVVSSGTYFEARMTYRSILAGLMHLRAMAQKMVEAYPCAVNGICHCPTCVTNHALAVTSGWKVG